MGVEQRLMERHFRAFQVLLNVDEHRVSQQPRTSPTPHPHQLVSFCSNLCKVNTLSHNSFFLLRYFPYQMAFASSIQGSSQRQGWLLKEISVNFWRFCSHPGGSGLVGRKELATITPNRNRKTVYNSTKGWATVQSMHQSLGIHCNVLSTINRQVIHTHIRRAKQTVKIIRSVYRYRLF
jgi:hypothetical protein